MKSLDSLTFKGGEAYSFSVVASGSGNMMLSLQYTDASGETKYEHIASGESSGEYVQLANAEYTLPEGSGYILYVETETGSDSFTIDEAIVAKAGTQINGPVVTTTTTTTTTSTTTTTTTTTTTLTSTTTTTTTVTTTPETTTTTAPQDPKAALEAKVTKWGDANCDDNIDMGDAVLIMQSLANPGKYQLSEEGKYNGDVYEAGGGITNSDASTIQKYLLGLLKEFPENYAENITSV